MLEPIKQKPRKITLGYPKCVCAKPFKLVYSKAEERAWIAEKGDIEIVKSDADEPVKTELSQPSKKAIKE